MRKIFFIGSGIGRIKRGFEAHIEDLFNNVKSTNGKEVFLFKAADPSSNKEIKIPHLPRNSPLAKTIAFIIGRNTFYVQNITFFVGLIPHLIRNSPDIIYLGEPIICNFLTKWRKLTKQKFKIIFFTGGQTIPAFIDTNDIIHHVTPLCIKKATDRGIPEKNQLLIPHFLNLSVIPRILSSEEKNKLKSEFNIPEDSTIVLSVGAIDYSVKRMDYLIKEVNKLQENIFLIILGEEESETTKIKELAKEYISKEKYIIKTLPRIELQKYYAIADLFVLASLAEGFGMVYIEALSYGVPVIAHDYLVSRYVLKNNGYFSDLSKEENLKMAINHIIKNKPSASDKHNMYQFVYQNYSWEKLKADYIKMLN